ncbi:LysR family transcriptional regulator [Paenibacillus sp. P25]|nr:LysR family transcriptional regulator [Paenibacillus sp. P25]
MVDNLDAYRVFYFIAKTGSLTKAAEELYITRPAVTHTLKLLESRLGGKLFFRSSKGVKLTTEGEVLFKYIEQAYHFISSGEKKIAEMHQLLSGEIKIGAGDTLCKHYLLPYLKTFHEAYPDIKIQVTNRTTPDTVKLLKEGKIDFGIVHLPIAEKNLHVPGEPANRGRVYRRRNIQPAREGAGVLGRAEPLSYSPIGAGDQHPGFYRPVRRGRGIQLRPEIELGSIDLLVEFARSGLGIACVVKSFISRELEQPGLYEIKLERPIPPRKVGIVTLKDVPLSAASQRFIELLPSL